MTPLSPRRGLAGLMVLFALTGVSFLTPGCGGSDSTETTTTETATLSAEDQAATRIATIGATVTASALDTMTYLSDTVNTRQEATETTFSPISDISVVTEGDTKTVTLDYGTTAVTTYGGREISGVITLTANSTTGTGAITFTNVTIDGRTVNGTVSLSNLLVSSAGTSGTVGFDLTVSGVGRSVGTLSLSTTRETRLVTFSSGNFTTTPEGSTTTYTVAVNNLVIDPVGNGNFTPESGTLTVSYPVRQSTITTLVTYTESSPSTGVVSVSVNGGEAVSYTLPGY